MPTHRGAVAYCVRADARRSWPSWLALGVLVGVAVGAVVAAAAGARRTDSAYRSLRKETAALTALGSRHSELALRGPVRRRRGGRRPADPAGRRRRARSTGRGSGRLHRRAPRRLPRRPAPHLGRRALLRSSRRRRRVRHVPDAGRSRGAGLEDPDRGQRGPARTGVQRTGDRAPGAVRRRPGPAG